MAARRAGIHATEQRVVLGLGALTGVGLALGGLSPTGSTVTDWILLVLAGAGAAWAAAGAPWWALAAVAGVAAAIAEPWLPIVIGVGVLAFALSIGMVRRSQPILRAATAGGTILVLSTARELRWFGINTLVAILLVSAMIGLGLWGRSYQQRRVAFTVLGAAATVLAIGALGVFAAGASARPDLSEGNRTAREGLRQLKSGEFESAERSFELAATAFERADSDLGAVWAQPSRLVPIASQHRRAGAVLADAAAAATRTIQQQLELVDLDSLRIVDGRIDIDAVRALRTPLAELQATLDVLDTAVLDARNPWLLGRIIDELDELEVDIAEQRDLGDQTLAALEVAPAILGADGERVYFVMFTTPAEARGQGGFMGNWAELSLNDGRIEMTAFGRTTDLALADVEPRTVTGPEDWLARYGRFGFTSGPDDTVAQVAFSYLTVSPHFPSTAQVAAELYPQSGGRPIDGVISLDVEVMARLVGIVGPVTIEGVELTAENTSEFLLVGQYERESAERVDLLEDVAHEIVDRLLAGAAGEPLELGRALVDPARQGRLLAWSPLRDEQAVILDAGIDGTLFRPGTNGAGAAELITLRVSNASGNKVDAYLERRVCVVADETGAPSQVIVELLNGAPSSGLPDYVIGNIVGEPLGSNRSRITLHSTMLVRQATVDGERVPLAPTIEAGGNAFSRLVVIPPNGRSEIVFELTSTTANTAPDRPDLWVAPQPLVRPESWATASFPEERCDEASFRPIDVPTTLWFP